MAAADVAAYRRWQTIYRWADGHDPVRAARARDVMTSIWRLLLTDAERRELKRGN